jgi:hypothetical protein
MRRHCPAGAALLLALIPQCFAPSPLVTGDVPTADKEPFEWYVGVRFQESESGNVARLLPFTELVYGLTDGLELTFETAGWAAASSTTTCASAHRRRGAGLRPLATSATPSSSTRSLPASNSP